MHKGTAHLAASMFALALLLGGPAAAAVPSPGTAVTRAEQALTPSVRLEPGHGGRDEHTTGNDDVAEWPEWARTDDPDDPEVHEDPDVHEDHGDVPAGAPERPRKLVLGSFTAVNGTVLLLAALMRRRTKKEMARRRSARAAACREDIDHADRH